MKGKTKWFPRHVHPVRKGVYECHVRIPGGCHVLWNLHFDGMGFLVPMPMEVKNWRGMTEAAYNKIQPKAKQ